MNNEIIKQDNELVKAFICSFDRILARLETVLSNSKPMLNGERFLTDVDVAERLKVSRRTLQDYRTFGKIPYIHLGGKILYRESDIQKILEKNYLKKWEY